MKALKKISIITFFVAILCQQGVVSQTPAPDQKPVRKAFSPDPQRATMLAITFPGFGQIYNRKYWKIPVVYGGFGTIIYLAGYNSSNYNTFMKAYQDFKDKIPETASYLNLVGLKEIDPKTYDPVLYPESANPSLAANYEEIMLNRVDYFRKYRDLSYIGVALWYVLTVLDANVDASLYNYDIKDNLDLVISPNQFQSFNSTAFGINVSLKVTF